MTDIIFSISKNNNVNFSTLKNANINFAVSKNEDVNFSVSRNRNINFSIIKSGATRTSELLDVETVDLQDDDILFYDFDSKKFKNKANFSGSYSDLSEKPLDFTPSAHTQNISTINGLQDNLDAKAAIAGNLTQDFSANEFNVSVINGFSAQNLLSGQQPVNFTGDIDGVNKVFITDEIYPNIRIELNGVGYSPDILGTYVLDTLTFDTAPELDDELEIYAITAEPNIGDGFFRPKASAEINAPINSFFYSTDQNQLAYKDSSGVISYIF